jgi:hypothetical protein
MRKILTAAVCLLAALPCAVQAAPLIIATSIIPMCNGNVANLTVTLDSTTYAFYGDSLYYHFDPPSAGTLAGLLGNPAEVQLPLTFAAGSSHTLLITTSAASTGGSTSQSYPITMPACGSTANSKGMTWKLTATNVPTGTISVGCGNTCDAIHGDTPCTTALPLLCIRKAGTGFPLPRPASVSPSNQYNLWSGGVIGTTSAVVPPATLPAADAQCASAFGANWRVAEFHDAWGWGFQAYGGVGNPASRFWVHINDQSGATCWY